MRSSSRLRDRPPGAGDDDADGQIVEPPDDVGEKAQRLRIGPLRVVEREQHGRAPREPDANRYSACRIPNVASSPAGRARPAHARAPARRVPGSAPLRPTPARATAARRRTQRRTRARRAADSTRTGRARPPARGFDELGLAEPRRPSRRIARPSPAPAASIRESIRPAPPPAPPAIPRHVLAPAARAWPNASGRRPAARRAYRNGTVAFLYLAATLPRNTKRYCFVSDWRTPHDPQDTRTADPRRWWTLVVLCLSLLVISLDNTILNVALPTLQATSALALAAPVDRRRLHARLRRRAAHRGALGDRFGRKGALAFGLAVFGLGSRAVGPRRPRRSS